MTLQLNICADPEVVKLLLEHNNRPMKALYEALEDKANRGTELPMAIIMDQRCGIERRAEEADVLLRFLVGATPLMIAIFVGRLDVAKALLAAGADPNTQASDGRNSLLAAAPRANLEVIELLISYGVDIDAVDNGGSTALHYATNRRHASVIELLERSGANLEAVDKKGRTPLHGAASNNEVGTIKALIALGANQAAVDIDGRTPLHCAAEYMFISVGAIEAFRFNVAAFEANLTALDKNGRTPLQVYESFSSADSKILAVLTPK